MRNQNDIGVIAHETGHHFSETSRPVRALMKAHEALLRAINPLRRQSEDRGPAARGRLRRVPEASLDGAGEDPARRAGPVRYARHVHAHADGRSIAAGRPPANRPSCPSPGSARLMAALRLENERIRSKAKVVVRSMEKMAAGARPGRQPPARARTQGTPRSLAPRRRWRNLGSMLGCFEHSSTAAA